MKNSNLKYLVIGNGFLGTSLASNLLALPLPDQFHNGLKRPQFLNASNLAGLRSFLNSIEHHVFINASGSSSIQESIQDPDQFLSNPVMQISSHIKILGELDNPPTYIYISSAAVYGETTKAGRRETDNCNPISPYGAGRQNAENALRELSKTYAGKIIVLRVFSAYNQLLRKQIPYIISEKIVQGLKVELYGTGDETRDFIHTSDVCRAIEFLNSNIQKESFSIFNLGTGDATSIFELTQIANLALCELGRSVVEVDFNQISKEGDPENLVANMISLESMGFSISISPKIGMLDYFRSLLK